MFFQPGFRTRDIVGITHEGLHRTQSEPVQHPVSDGCQSKHGNYHHHHFFVTAHPLGGTALIAHFAHHGHFSLLYVDGIEKPKAS